MKKDSLKFIIVLVLWILPVFLTPFTPAAMAQGSDWSFMSSDLDLDGLPNGVEEAGWCNSAGCFQTDPLDSDSDDDGLTDGQEKLYETDPLNEQSPGIYVEYENPLMTRQYFAKAPFWTQSWGWQQYGDRYISFDAVVVRRGTTFSVGGPADATIQITESLVDDSLTNLTPVRDTCGERWRISVPSGGTVGKYQVTLQRGDWSKSLNLYIIFELPTPDSSFTQAMINTFVYDDNPENARDERGILLGDRKYVQSEAYPWIPSGGWINAGLAWQFNLQQFEPFVFEEHVIEAINGNNNQEDAAYDLVEHADKVTRFDYPRWLSSSYFVLHPPGGDDRNQCSNIAALLTAFNRAAGIPARPFFTDWVNTSFDHATEIWLNGEWHPARGYTQVEPEGCGWECQYGHIDPTTRYSWGRWRYKPWHSGGNGSSSTVMAADENWVWSQSFYSTDPAAEEYRWASWDWDGVVGKGWFDMLFVPYWSYWGWSDEPEITQFAPDVWPAVTDFSIDVSPNSQTVTQTHSTSYTVSLDTSDGFSNRVTLEVLDLPDNTTHSFQPDNFCVPDCTSTLVITTSGSTPLGTFSPRVRTTKTGLARKQEIVDLSVVTDTVSTTAASQALGAMSVDGEAGLTVHGVRDYGVDLDGDGYFDQLMVEIEVSATQPGSYWLRGELGVDHPVPNLFETGGLIAVAVVRADLAEGTNTVRLPFDGLSISAAKVDGPYVLKYLSITDVDNPGRDEFANDSLGDWISLYTTAAYRASEFENRGAVLSGQISETGLDADGDGLYEALTLNVGLDIFEPGTYTVQGDLYDSQEQFVARASWTGTGSTASLQFDVAGTAGPYTLRELNLLNAEGQSIDWVFEAYTTQQVVAAEITTHLVDLSDTRDIGIQVILPGTYYDDAGVDTDGDGQFDQLVITTTLEIEEGEGGQAYRVEGWLVDTHGSLVSWAVSDPQVLDVGPHSLALAFDGRIIKERGVDGPFTLIALKALPGDTYNVLDEVNVAYTTSAYNHDDFEGPVVVPTAMAIFEDDMENGAGQWSAGSFWDLNDNAWHSYSHAWEADVPGSQTSRLTNIDLLGLPTYSNLTLRFRTCYEMQSAGDVGYLQASTDGLEWTEVATYTGSAAHWTTEYLDLTQFQGASGLQFRFEADSQSGSGLMWYIDDVYLNALPDDDRDGILTLDEDLNGDGDPTNDDSDGDGIPDYLEPNNEDTDDDGNYNHQDPDDDGDGVPTADETGNDDSDNDGAPDYLDADDDNDGIPTADEDFNGDGNPANDDSDGDGTSNYLDTDDDEDGILTTDEDLNDDDDPTNDDSDGDHVPDYLEPNDRSTVPDDEIPDYLDPDDDGDGVPTAEEDWNQDGNPTNDDGDGNGVPDYLDPDVSEAPTKFIYLPIVVK